MRQQQGVFALNDGSDLGMSPSRERDRQAGAKRFFLFAQHELFDRKQLTRKYYEMCMHLSVRVITSRHELHETYLECSLGVISQRDRLNAQTAAIQHQTGCTGLLDQHI